MVMAPAPVMAMSPPHLLRPKPIDLVAGCHGWMGTLIRLGAFNERLRN
jgi:hypothetical protein